MNKRRELLRAARARSAASSWSAAGCSISSARQWQPRRPPARRNRLAIAGQRVKTIDVHAHCVIPQALELMGMDVFSLYPRSMQGGQECIDRHRRAYRRHGRDGRRHGSAQH